MEQLKREITKENFRRDLHNEFLPKVQEILKDYIGKKVTKIDGYPVAKLEKQVKELHEHKKSLHVYLKASYSCIRLHVRDSYYNDKEEIVYVDDSFLVGEYESKKSESGILESLQAFEPLEHINYETELQKMRNVENLLLEIQPALDDLSYITRRIVKDTNWRFFR